MSVLFNKDRNEIIINCNCGCEDSVHLRFEKIEDDICFLTWMYGNLQGFKSRIKYVWNMLLRNNYPISDVIMSKKDFYEFVKFIEEQKQKLERGE